MRSVVIAALVGALVLVMAPVGMAAHVQPTLIAGNPSCEGGVKIEPVEDGTFAVPGGTITIDVTNSSFDFTANVVTTTSRSYARRGGHRCASGLDGRGRTQIPGSGDGPSQRYLSHPARWRRKAPTLLGDHRQRGGRAV